MIKEWYDLTRLDHGVMWGVAVVIGEILAMRGIPKLEYVFLGFFIPFFLEIGIFALNDYFDYESDKINKRFDRPLVRGTIKRRHALYLGIFALPVAVILGLVLAKALTILFAFLLLGVFYNYKLKEYFYIKNLIVASCMAIPFIGGNLVVRDDVIPIIWFISIIALVLGVSRELMKDMMDVEGDVLRGCKTLPILIGKRKSAYIVVTLYVFTIIATFIPFLFKIDENYYHNFYYLAPILVTNLIVLYTCNILLKSQKLEYVKKSRNYTLTAMKFGILGFLAGALL